jgi:hypothetical protein
LAIASDSGGHRGADRPARGRGVLRRLVTLAGTLALCTAGAVVAWGVLMAMAPRPVTLPVWMLAEIEARLARAAEGSGGVGVSIGAITADVAEGDPRLTLADLRLTGGDGAVRLRLPRIEARFDAAALARGTLRLTGVTAPGADIRLIRSADGTFDLRLGDDRAAAITPAGLAAGLQALFARPELRGTAGIAATGATLTLEDRRTGRIWRAGAGSMRLAPAADGAIRLDAGLDFGGAAVRLGVTLAADGAVGLAATVERLAAGDLAGLVPPLGFLAALDAPLSGAVEAAALPDGTPLWLAGRLSLGAGSLDVGEAGPPLPVQSADLAFRYRPEAHELAVESLTVASPVLRLAARGTVTAVEDDGQPLAFTAALRLGDVQIDPAGVFAEPLRYGDGALALRLELRPFAVTLDRLSLVAPEHSLTAAGGARATPDGWEAALDAAIDRIAAERLLQLWPLALLPGTRAWLAANVLGGTLFDIALRLDRRAGAAAAVTASYAFEEGAVRVVRGLPPITGAAGRAALAGGAFTLTLDAGRVEPPEGGAIDLAGSSFRVGDIARVPGMGEVAVVAAGRVTAILSLLDEPPFRFISRAGFAPDVAAAGEARLEAHLTLPLIDRVTAADVAWSAAGTMTAVRSTRLMPGRVFAAERLTVAADPAGVSIGGAMVVDGVAAEATWTQPLGPAPLPPARVEGEVALTPAFAAAFLPGLPAGALGGAGRGSIVIDLPRGAPARLRLTSDLAGVGLRIPALGWEKAPGTRGRLAIDARLGPGQAVEALTLEAPGLSARGSARFAAGGGLERLRLDRLRLGDWFDAALEVGPGGAVTLTGGRLDLRRRPGERGPGERGPGEGWPGEGGPSPDGLGGGGAPVAVTLDRVDVTDRIALTGVTGRIESRSGLSGRFAARLNGTAPVTVGIEGRRQGGIAIRVQSDDAGATLAAAGLFRGGRGGTLDLVATPRAGGFDGRIELRAFRVVGMPVLAEILNAVSIVGLIDQLSNSGLPFTRASARLRLDGATITVLDGMAEGPSFGVTLKGRYDGATDRLEMEGVLSPLYIVNGIGQVLTRPGEGIFGFTWRLSGPAARPRVTVNPLSVLAPGFLRNAFRAEDPGRPPQRVAPPPNHGAGDR